MEWNKPAAYQVPGAQTQASRRQRDDSGEQEAKEDHKTEQRATPPQTDRHGLRGIMQTPPPSFPSLKAEPSFNNVMGLNNGAMTLHDLNSLEMQHLDEADDFPQLFPTPHNGLPPGTSATTPSQQHYVLPPSQFAQLPSTMPGFYGLQTLAPQQGVHSTMDYFSEGFQGFHGAVMTPTTPTLPATFSSQQQQRGFDDRNEDFSDVQTMFSTPLAIPSSVGATSRPAVPPLSNHAAHQQLHRSAPAFAETPELPIASGPKFSPDHRKLCCVEGCTSQARAFNRCKRHGGSKRCSHVGCTKSVQSRGLCIRHGGGSRCQESGCTRASQSHGRCKMHGGGRPCIVAGCDKKAHLKRLCRKHGGGAKCSSPGCEKWAQRQGMCMTHSKAAHPPTSGSGATSTIGTATAPTPGGGESQDRRVTASPTPPPSSTPRPPPPLQLPGPSSTYMPA